MEFGIVIPAIPLPEKSQKECGLRQETAEMKNVNEIIFFKSAPEKLPNLILMVLILLLKDETLHRVGAKV